MSSRREQKEALKAEREQQQAAAEAATRRKRLVGLGAAGALAAAALIAVAVVALAGGDDGGKAGIEGEVYPPDDVEVPEPRETELGPAAKAAGCTVKDEKAEGNQHVEEPVVYRSNPAHSGDHYLQPADDGTFEEPVATENWVHSLEHGRLVVQFKPTVPGKARAILKKQHDEDPFHMILLPNSTKMPFEVAASAWTRDPQPLGTGHLLGCPKINDRVYDAIAAFRSRYRDNDVPPENVP